MKSSIPDFVGRKRSCSLQRVQHPRLPEPPRLARARRRRRAPRGGRGAGGAGGAAAEGLELAEVHGVLVLQHNVYVLSIQIARVCLEKNIGERCAYGVVCPRRT